MRLQQPYLESLRQRKQQIRDGKMDAEIKVVERDLSPTFRRDSFHSVVGVFSPVFLGSNSSSCRSTVLIEHEAA